MTEPTAIPPSEPRDKRTLLIGAAIILFATLAGFGLSRLGSNDNLITDGATAAENPPTTPPVTLTDVTAPPRTTITPTTTTTTTTTTTAPPPPTTIEPQPFTGDYAICPEGSEPVASQGVIKDGVITLAGDVPTFDDAERIIALAEQILGAGNVDNQYRLCPTAADPNDGRIVVEDAVLFDSGSAVIAEEFTPLLNQGIGLMTIRPSVTITILGHTDDIGSNEYNGDLSQRRAQAVMDYLVTNGSVDPDRLTPIGVGELNPIDTNETEQGRQRNRRIEFLLTNLLADE